MPYLGQIRHDLESKCTCWLYLALSFLHEFSDDEFGERYKATARVIDDVSSLFRLLIIDKERVQEKTKKPYINVLKWQNTIMYMTLCLTPGPGWGQVGLCMWTS
jgi:hypothetical protein